MPNDLSERTSPWQPVPYNPLAEQALLGALLSNSRAAYPQVAEFLAPEHFFDPVHQAIYSAIARRADAGMVADATVLLSEFADSDVLAEVGGVSYLGQLLGSMVGIINAGDYGRVIRDAAIHRELVNISQQMAEAARSSQPPADIVEATALQLDDLLNTGPAIRQSTLGEAAHRAIEGMERVFKGEPRPWVRTGFTAIDDRIGGLQRKTLNIVGAAPGMGKSSFGLQVAVNAAMAKEPVPVLYLSLEMASELLARRALSTWTRIPLNRQMSGVTQRDIDRSVEAQMEFNRLPLVIDDGGGMTAQMVAARMRRASRQKGGLGLLVVDHLNLVQADAQGAKHGGTWATEHAANMLLAIAQQYDIPVLALCQLNRGIAARDDKRPTLADLRQSGAIEQNGHLVAFIHREEYYLEREMPKEKLGEKPDLFNARMDEWQLRMTRAHNQADIIIAKNRDGDTGTVPLRWDGPTTTFSDLGRAEP